MSDLIDQLQAHPYRFDLFQALSLLERAYPERAMLGTSLGLDETVRIESEVTMAFAASDVVRVVQTSRPGPEVSLSSPVMSLAGATGPLPLVISEALLARRKLKDRAGLEFLDIFNQRMLAFLYRSRHKHRLSLVPRGVSQAPIFKVLDRLAGLGIEDGVRGPASQRPWLRHSALQNAAPRSMASLVAILSDRIGIPIQGRQFVGGWRPVEQADQAALRSRVAKGSQLGIQSTLGQKAWDQAAAIELTAARVPMRVFEDLLPGGERHQLMSWTALRHLQITMQVQLKLAVPDNDLTLRKLGVHGPGLARDAWLSHSQGLSHGAAYAPPRVNLSHDSGT